LIFQTLPIAFGQMPGGMFFGTLFFILLSFAAWTSAISLIEPAITWLVENKNITRVRACTVAGGLTWLVGLGTVMSFNVTAEVKLFDKTFFDLLDYLTSNIMLPLGGLAMALFVVWVMPKPAVVKELNMGQGPGFETWFLLLKFVAPIAVIIVFLKAIGIL